MDKTCKICGGSCNIIFNKQILKKHSADYLQCENCGFLFISKPVWLDEAYSSAISCLDVGLVSRNLYLADQTIRIIKKNNIKLEKCLDYGGGYGLFVRLMRDKGKNFFWHDPYCDNLFSKGFEAIKDESKYTLLTAFEVFEHLIDPKNELSKMFEYSDTILFSTELVTNRNKKQLSQWWYLATETGQHISFYTIDALQNLAKQYNANFISNNKNIHIFSKRYKQLKFPNNVLNKFLKRIYTSKNNASSLIDSDFNYLKNKKNGL